MKITVTFHPAKGSIADVLAQKLGRPATNSELRDEVCRILRDAKETRSQSKP